MVLRSSYKFLGVWGARPEVPLKGCDNIVPLIHEIIKRSHSIFILSSAHNFVLQKDWSRAFY